MPDKFPVMAENKQHIDFAGKMLLKNKSIGISAVPGSGKQTFIVECLSCIRKKKKMNIIRVEMAGARKSEDLVRILLHELHNHFFSSRITFIEAWQTWLTNNTVPVYVDKFLLHIIPGKEELYLENILEFLRILIRKTNPLFCWFSSCESLVHWKDTDTLKTFLQKLKKIPNCYVIISDTLEYETYTHQHILGSITTFIPLYSPSNNAWIKWMMPKFKERNIQLTRSQAGKIASSFKEFPLYTCQLIEWLLFQAGRDIHLREYESAKMEIIERYAPWFHQQVHALSNTQFNLLRAVCSPELKYTSAKVMQQYSLGTPRNVVKNLETLQRNGLIKENGKSYFISDPAFEIWFRMNFM